VSVYIGGHQLVDRSTTSQMKVVTPVGQSFNQVQWSDGSAVAPSTGQLAGELTARDSIVQSRIDGVNQLASRVIDQVNALHESGVDLNGNPGVPFFSGKDATDMAVSPQLTGSTGTNYVAAARQYQVSAGPPPTFTYAKGDSSNAVALGELANSTSSVDTSTGLGANPTVGSMTVSAISVNGAAASGTYAYNWDSTHNTLQVTTSPNGSTADVAATLQGNADNSGQVMTIDGQGVRLTVSVPNGTDLQTALQAMSGQSVTTGPNPSTISNQYSQFVAALGVDSNTAQGQSANEALLVTQLQTQQQSVSGVSMDEETTHLIQYQRAYEAAAHVVSVMDSMLDTLINHTAGA
jgi:flagellar hook-associated protein 1 FlgK